MTNKEMAKRLEMFTSFRGLLASPFFIVAAISYSLFALVIGENDESYENL